ncbi:MAG: alpha/beta fold hydrolase [Myxococcota bacterium]
MTVPDAPSTHEPERIALATGPVSYVDEGPKDAPAVVLVHGIPGSARDFRWLTPALIGLRGLRVEMPGFGATPLATGPGPSVEARAQFLVSFLDALALSNVILVGHSMGGVVATAAADLAPERVAGVGLVASPGLRVHRGFRQFGSRRALSAALRVPGVAFATGGLLQRAFRGAGFRHCSRAEVIHTIHCVAATSIPDHARRLERLQLPAFHAFCEDDPLVEVAITSETARTLGGPALRFSTGGHNPQKHHAVELGAALRTWVTELGLT